MAETRNDSNVSDFLFNKETSQLKWKGSLEQLKSFVETTLSLTGNWSSPTDYSEQFTTDPKSVSITFCNTTKTLLIQGRSKDSKELKQVLLNKATPKKPQEPADDEYSRAVQTIEDNEGETSENGDTRKKMAGVGNNCEERCFKIYPKQEGHIKQRARDERILGSKGQFCAAFYHVHEGRHREHFCLDENNCIIAKEAKDAEEAKKANAWFVPPKTVVAVVKFEKVDGSILYEARYTNCGPKKKHAEDFFKEDIKDGVLAEIVQDNPNGTITMYLTLQPCNKSTSIKPEGTQNTKRDQSCCDILKTIVRERLRNAGRNINLCIKAAHTNRLSLKTETGDNETLRQNAVRGIKQLMRIEGVNVSGMTPEDWGYLLSLTDDFDSREDLDIDVQNILEKIHRINLP